MQTQPPEQKKIRVVHMPPSQTPNQPITPTLMYSKFVDVVAILTYPLPTG